MNRPSVPRALPLVLALGMLLVATPSRADDSPSDLQWNPSWSTFRPAEYVVTGVAGVASIAALFALQAPDQPRWTGGILFDDAARDAFRLRSPGARDTIRNVSDVTTVTAAALVVGVDSLIVPLARDRASVAWQLLLMDAESFAVSTLVTTTMYDGVGRARPSYADCQRDPSFDPLCNTGSTASFPSGHTNVAFTAAGLSCAHHANLALYGGGFADTAGCIGELTIATATASFRVMGDRHYVSDVLVGGLIGFGVGFGAPMLLHYGTRGHRGDQSLLLAPMGGTSTAGILASGTF